MRGLTQEDLARAVDVADGTAVSKWETGFHQISLGNLAAVSRIVGQPIAWFYEDHDEEDAADPEEVAA